MGLAIDAQLIESMSISDEASAFAHFTHGHAQELAASRGVSIKSRLQGLTIKDILASNKGARRVNTRLQIATLTICLAGQTTDLISADRLATAGIQDTLPIVATSR